mmetsp:Transcript_74874/g.178085  ORF Transcript_74874/g.178085 Transcript_74874/m.178085 type:complete len:517 (-) Transcript_74874:100-1650(-)
MAPRLPAMRQLAFVLTVVFLYPIHTDAVRPADPEDVLEVDDSPKPKEPLVSNPEVVQDPPAAAAAVVDGENPTEPTNTNKEPKEFDKDDAEEQVDAQTDSLLQANERQKVDLTKEFDLDDIEDDDVNSPEQAKKLSLVEEFDLDDEEEEEEEDEGIPDGAASFLEESEHAEQQEAVHITKVPMSVKEFDLDDVDDEDVENEANPHAKSLLEAKRLSIKMQHRGQVDISKLPLSVKEFDLDDVDDADVENEADPHAKSLLEAHRSSIRQQREKMSISKVPLGVKVFDLDDDEEEEGDGHTAMLEEGGASTGPFTEGFDLDDQEDDDGTETPDENNDEDKDMRMKDELMDSPDKTVMLEKGRQTGTSKGFTFQAFDLDDEEEDEDLPEERRPNHNTVMLEEGRQGGASNGPFTKGFDLDDNTDDEGEGDDEDTSIQTETASMLQRSRRSPGDFFDLDDEEDEREAQRAAAMLEVDQKTEIQQTHRVEAFDLDDPEEEEEEEASRSQDASKAQEAVGPH